MHFFKSIFSDNPAHLESQVSSNAPQNKEQDDLDRHSLPTEHPNRNDGGWNFGGLVRTLSSTSESVIETYRRDLKEFGSGLKKEIEIAHASMGTVGQAIDEFGNSVVKGTALIISQGKDAILSANLDLNSHNHNQKYNSEKSLNSKLYSRFDAQVHAIQADAGTYCEVPEDLDDYNNWKLEFSLEGKNVEIESFLKENDAIASIYQRVIPKVVDHETFWYRYYYKIYKFKKAEDVRARLVRRMTRQEEELSWDVEDDDDWEYESKAKPDLLTNNEAGALDLGKRVDTEPQMRSSATSNEGETDGLNVEKVHISGEEESKVESRDSLLPSKELGHDTNNSIDESKVETSEVVPETDDGSKKSYKKAGGDEALNMAEDTSGNKIASLAKSDEKVVTERKADDGKSSDKDNYSSLVASQQHPAPEEEDLGWDEIEDLIGIGEKKSNQTGSQNEAYLRKRLTAAEEEDLSWDVDDDDDDGPPKPKA